IATSMAGVGNMISPRSRRTVCRKSLREALFEELGLALAPVAQPVALGPEPLHGAQRGRDVAEAPGGDGGADVAHFLAVARELGRVSHAVASVVDEADQNSEAQRTQRYRTLESGAGESNLPRQ